MQTGTAPLGQQLVQMLSAVWERVNASRQSSDGDALIQSIISFVYSSRDNFAIIFRQRARQTAIQSDQRGALLAWHTITGRVDQIGAWQQ